MKKKSPENAWNTDIKLAKMEPNIGEYIQLSKTLYVECVQWQGEKDAHNRCLTCRFYYTDMCTLMKCYANERKDQKDVHFKKAVCLEPEIGQELSINGKTVKCMKEVPIVDDDEPDNDCCFGCGAASVCYLMCCTHDSRNDKSDVYFKFVNKDE